MLRAPTHMLSRLHDGNPKIIILTLDSAQPDNELPLDQYVFQLVDDDHFTLVQAEEDGHPNADIHIFDLPPSNVWAFWAPGLVQDTSLDALKTWYANTGGKDLDAPIVKGSQKAVMELLLARSLREAQRLGNMNLALMRDLAVLRESWLNHVRIPAEIEELLANLRLASPRLIFNNSDTPDNVAISIESRIIQPLPIGARGLLGFDLNVIDVGAGSGILFAQLLARDTGAVLARGQIAFDALCPGWIPFRLQSASAASSHSLELHIWTESEIGATAPQIAATPAGLLSRFSFDPQANAVRSSQLLAQMLALKLWGGLPGVAMYTFEGELVNDQLTALEVPLPDSLVETVRLTREMTAPYPVFGYMERGKVLLRPLKAIPSAAVIRLPATRGLIEISCEVFIDDRRCEARHLGTRVVVTSRGVEADAAERGEGVLAATDWVELTEPLTPSRLIVRLPDMQNEPVDVHLFTRLPKPGPVPPHGRIVFNRFVAEVHAASAWNVSPIMLREP
ncbi:hypothetical protein CU102_26025 [Phyllobacterium brassicacearum]|uniref:Uncharacterized protein n=1 Tax=Phyllobacterium brassicacearum TaxID=314235 RepID=A0A2P7B6E5_9HYPH|nr:DUF6212 domain-containing protein [Phyllobacterium brassicacearum]PSH62033.1 hypothetical protein CU102_26025 [Phyllobacterium brassicacearum]TDQ16696.1 hypothetical protein DEV91_13219 [Phyllobacterium brassicacearum]